MLVHVSIYVVQLAKHNGLIWYNRVEIHATSITRCWLVLERKKHDR